MKKNITLIVLFISFSLFNLELLSQSKEIDYEQREAPRAIQTIEGDYPILRIFSDLDLTFPDHQRFAKIVSENKKSSPYEYVLLIDTQGKTIPLRVAVQGFIPTTIEVTDLAPKKTIDLHIFEKRPVLNLAKGEFQITTTPEGAEITIDGYPSFTGHKTPYTFKDWTATGYKIKLRKKDYYDADTVIIIDNNKPGNLNVKMRAKFGILKLSTHPSNEFIIDNISYNHTNPIQIAEGRHTLTVRKKYFKDYSETINVTGYYDPMVIEKIVELEPYKGVLEVNTEPLGAEVLLNGNNIGNTPIS